jgi:hypothetical protein
MTLSRRLGSLLLFVLIAALTALAGCDLGCDIPSGRSRGPEPVVTAPDPAVRDAPRFAPGQLEQHFEKHGAEMGIATQDDYLRAAQALVRGGPGVETFQRGGDTLFFKAQTGEFAVLSSRNVIRTYFRPSDGPRYWERQKQRSQ